MADVSSRKSEEMEQSGAKACPPPSAGLVTVDAGDGGGGEGEPRWFEDC